MPVTAGPIGIADVDRAIDATRRGRSIGRNSPNTDGFQSRLTAEMLRNTQRLAQATSNIRDSQDQMNVLARKRAELQEGYNKAVARGNTELQEHYKRQLNNLREQRGYVYDTLRAEERRRKVESDLLALNQRQGQLSEADTRRQQRLATAQALLNQRLLVRNTIQRTAVQQNISMARAEQQITRSIEQQVHNREQLAQQAAQVQERINPLSSQSGLTMRQRMTAGALGVASGVTASSTWDKLKGAMSGLFDMSDLATEAQYTFGTTLDRNTKGMKDYKDRAIDLAMVNADIGMSYAKMGLDSEDSNKAMSLMLASSGTALRAYQNQNYKLLEQMTNSVGAFSRQNNMSLEDAVSMQSLLLDRNNMSIEQADAEMNKVSASIRVMNNQLVDAGFKGALLNVGELANITKQAAESTESLSFNTSLYTERLSKAAKNARLLGSSQKEAVKFASGHMALLSSKSAYMDLRQGQGIVKKLNALYSKEVQSKDMEALVLKLQKEQGITDVDQATMIASTLINQRSIPNVANLMADLTRDSKIQQDTMLEEIDKVMASAGAKSASDIMSTVMNPLVAASLGFDPNDPNSRKQLMGEVKRYMFDKGIIAPSKAIAPTYKAPTDTDIAKALAEQQAKAGAAGTQEWSNWNIGRLKNQFFNIIKNPLVQAPLVGAGFLGTFGLAKLAGRALSNAPTGGLLSRIAQSHPVASSVLQRFNRYTSRAFWSNLLSGGASTATGVGQQAAPGLLSRVGGGLVRGVAKHKVVAGILAALGLGAGAYAAFSGSDEEKQENIRKNIESANEEPIDTLDDNTKATKENTEAMKAVIRAQNEQVSPTPENPKAARKPEEYTQSWTENIGSGLLNAGIGLTASKLTDKVISMMPQAAQSALPAVGWGAKAIPGIGSLVSAGLTYKMTQGSTNRKLAASGGDLAGGLVGLIPALGGGKFNWAWSALGETIATGLYDQSVRDDASKNYNMQDAFNKVSSVSDATYKQQAPTNTGGSDDLGVLPQPATVGIGNIGPVRPDGSVNMTVRVSGFTTAVNQASVSNFARATQFSGAQR